MVSCSSQTHLQPLPVQTQGMQLLKLFIQVYDINSHQHYELSQLRYHIVQCSKMTVVVNHIMYKIEHLSHIRQKDNLKTAGAVILQLALKLQKGNNISVIPI